MVDMNCRLKNRLYDDYVGGERLVDQNLAQCLNAAHIGHTSGPKNLRSTTQFFWPRYQATI